MERKEKKAKYGMRKLSIGFVSCLLGFATIFSPVASSVKTAVYAEEVTSDKEDKEDLTTAKKTAKDNIEKTTLTEEEKKGKTADSIKTAEAKLAELKEAAVKAIEAAETTKAINDVKVNKQQAIDLLVAEPEKTKVVNTTKLTLEEKDAVKTAVKEANKTLPEGAEIEVADNGDVTIKYADKSTDTIPAAKTVEAMTTAEKTKIADLKERIEVGDYSKLTDEENKKVLEEVKKANKTLPEGAEIEVADNGDVTIKYADKSYSTIEAIKVIVPKNLTVMPTYASASKLTIILPMKVLENDVIKVEVSGAEKQPVDHAITKEDVEKGKVEIKLDSDKKLQEGQNVSVKLFAKDDQDKAKPKSKAAIETVKKQPMAPCVESLTAGEKSVKVNFKENMVARDDKIVVEVKNGDSVETTIEYTITEEDVKEGKVEINLNLDKNLEKGQKVLVKIVYAAGYESEVKVADVEDKTNSNVGSETSGYNLPLIDIVTTTTSTSTTTSTTTTTTTTNETTPATTATTGWFEDNGSWYYGDKEGKTLKSTWLKDANKWYYLYESGKMASNEWVKVDNVWYWANGSGSISQNEWVYVNGSWFWANSSGRISENEWVFVNDSWYYAENGGYIVMNQWKEINGKWYFFNQSGALLVSTTTPDGYKVNANGEWI